MVGPVIGGFLYNAFDYFFTFFIFSMILVLNLVITVMITPDSLNNDSTAEEENEENSLGSSSNKIKREVNFKMFLSNKRTMLTYLSCVVVCISISY